jgi:hypothetical protein
MTGKPLFARAMTAAERQQRHRDKVKVERIERRQAAPVRLAEPLPCPPDLDQVRRSIGRIAQHLVDMGDAMGDAASLARLLARVEGPTLPHESMAKAGAWLTRFAKSYRYAAIARQVFLAEMRDATSDGGGVDQRLANDRRSPAP